MKKTIFWIALCTFFLTSPSKANKIVSVADGNWEDSTVWSGGSPPGFSVWDTVEISHCIFFNANLQFNSGAFVTIEDSGKICGHHNIHMLPGSEFDIFGRVYFDTIFVQGYLYIKNNNQAWIGQLITITAPGHSLFVGPGSFTYYPFNCSCDFDSIPSQWQDTLSVAEDPLEIEVFPNPFTEEIYIETSANVDYFYLTDDTGRLIMRKKLEVNVLYLKNLCPGTYFLNFVLYDGGRITKKIVKLKTL